MPTNQAAMDPPRLRMPHRQSTLSSREVRPSTRTRYPLSGRSMDRRLRSTKGTGSMGLVPPALRRIEFSERGHSITIITLLSPRHRTFRRDGHSRLETTSRPLGDFRGGEREHHEERGAVQVIPLPDLCAGRQYHRPRAESWHGRGHHGTHSIER